MDRIPAVTFRGTQDGVLLRIHGTSDYEEIKRQLEEHIASSESFFRGAELLLELGDGTLTGEQLVDLERLVFRRCGATLSGTIPMLADVQAAPVASGDGDGQGRPTPLARERVSALLVRGTVRSGQRIRHHGHLLLVGDVNPGGEVVAAADVVVVGRLRGMAHAGVTGRRDAVVIAGSLQPTQLRIAEFVTRSPDGTCPPAAIPEVARVDGDRIVIDTYLSYLEHGAGMWSGTPTNGRDRAWVSPSS